MRPRPGQVWTFDSGVAEHPKHHLCVHEDYRFLFLDTPRKPPFPSDCLIGNSDVPFLTPTKCGRSAISCSRLLRFDPPRFRILGPRCRGTASEAAMRKLVDHLSGLRGISEEERDMAMEGLGAFFVFAAA